MKAVPEHTPHVKGVSAQRSATQGEGFPPHYYCIFFSLKKIIKNVIFYIMEKNIYRISYELRRKLQKKILFVVGLVFAFFMVVSIFLNFIIYPVANKSDSMSPNLPAGSFEFVSPLSKNPNRGDVVLVSNYQGAKLSMAKKLIRTATEFVSLRKWRPFEQNPVYGTRPVLRRVIGLPGDTIYIDRYVVFIKPIGEKHFHTEFEFPLHSESDPSKSKYTPKILVPPANWDVDFGAKASYKEITLGEDEYFVLGDDRLSAADSRIWGPIKQSSIQGKAVLQFFPFSKFKIL